MTETQRLAHLTWTAKVVRVKGPRQGDVAAEVLLCRDFRYSRTWPDRWGRFLRGTPAENGLIIRAVAEGLDACGWTVATEHELPDPDAPATYRGMPVPDRYRAAWQAGDPAATAWRAGVDSALDAAKEC
ncbi:hypothetical protein [Streptomyces chilikensis]|uniref:Uncharacterized protein n=1 Tax=Streptomyces chilikensis TaxID=1194079 RepID=A0ABV3EJ98_9ACTN